MRCLVDNWERGRSGEAIARRWLLKNGYIVVATSDIDSGGAPMLLELERRVSLPDNITFRAGRPAFVEVKTYQRAAKEQKRQRWHHGILERHFIQYRRAASDCKIPCYLGIIQVDIWHFLLGELGYLAETMYRGLAPGPHGMEVYFDINRFEWFCLDDMDKLPPSEVKTRRPWEPKHSPVARQGPLF